MSLRGPYLLSAGDQVRIVVYQRDDLTGDHTISEDGTISLPLVGRLGAVGLFCFRLGN